MPRNPAVFQALRAIPQVFNLNVSHSDFGCEDLKRLSGAKILQLEASDTALTDCEITDLRLDELAYLRVEKTTIGSRFMSVIQRLPKLSSMWIRETGLNPSDVEEFRHVRPEVVVISR